jgi:hypothetical protein
MSGGLVKYGELRGVASWRVHDGLDILLWSDCREDRFGGLYDEVLVLEPDVRGCIFYLTL